MNKSALFNALKKKNYLTVCLGRQTNVSSIVKERLMGSKTRYLLFVKETPDNKWKNVSKAEKNVDLYEVEIIKTLKGNRRKENTQEERNRDIDY